MPKSISIKEAMGALGGKLVIGGVPKSGNKDDPDPDRPEKPKPKLNSAVSWEAGGVGFILYA